MNNHSGIQSLDMQTVLMVILIFETESVSKTAKLMNVHQSRVSYALNKARRVFDDRLFFRQANMMKPTQRGVDVYNDLKILYERLDTLAQKRQFIPAQSQRQFNILCTSLEGQLFLPKVNAKVYNKAPNVRLSVTQLRLDLVQSMLESSHDFAFSAHKPEDKSIRFMPLLERQEYGVFYDHNKRAAIDTMQHYLQARHVIVVLGLNNQTIVDRLLKQKNKQRHVVLEVHDFSLLYPMIQGTDLITTVPKFCHPVMPGLSVGPCPLKVPALDVYLLWHERYQNDDGHKWFRALVNEVFKTMAQ